MRADDPEHKKAQKKLLELGPAKYEQELNSSAHQGNPDIRAGRAAIAEHRENQAAERHREQMKELRDTRTSQDAGNTIQRWILAVLVVTVLVSIGLAMLPESPP